MQSVTTAECKHSGVVGPSRVDVPRMSWCPSLVPLCKLSLNTSLKALGIIPHVLGKFHWL